jgi:hypothetical protein
MFIIGCDAFIFTKYFSAGNKKFVARTGDNELDTALVSINNSAKKNLKDFILDLSKTFNHPLEKLEKMINDYKMEPADAYMTMQVSKQSGKKVEEIAESFSKNRDKGWGVIAKEMGIKPGSKEFHALKDGAKGKDKKMKEEKGNQKDDKEKGGKGNGKGNNGKGSGDGKDKEKKK